MTRVWFLPDYSDTNPYQDLLAEELRSEGCQVRGFAAKSPVVLLEAVREHGVPDVVHVHWVNRLLLARNVPFTLLKSLLFIAQLVLLKALGARVVWTVHNLTEHAQRVPRTELAMRHLFVRTTDAGIVHCDSVVDLILDAYHLPDHYRDHFRVVPHGHYCDVYADEVSADAARRKLGVDDAFTYVFFGRVSDYKNVPSLVRAFGSLDDPDARLVIAGSPASDAVASAVEQAAAGDSRVRTHLEFIPPEAVQYYMRTADVVVLPFQEILTSGSTILAMSFGNAVIVPDAGCVSAYVPEDGGFTFSDSDPDALARTIADVRQADTDRVGAANYDAISDLDWGPIAERTLSVYRASAEPDSRRSCH